MPISLLALAISVFAIGTAEFVSMGRLPASRSTAMGSAWRLIVQKNLRIIQVSRQLSNGLHRQILSSSKQLSQHLNLPTTITITATCGR